MTDTVTQTVEVKWHKVPAVTPPHTHITALHCRPDIKRPDHFILTMDGPRGGEYGNITVTLQQLLEMLVSSEKERARVQTVLASRK